MTALLKVFEVITEDGLNLIKYDSDKCKYIWEGVEEKNFLDLLTKHFPSDWWYGYPLYVHGDYKSLVARRMNYIIHNHGVEIEDKIIKPLIKGSIGAWKEHLNYSWDYTDKQFIVQ